MSWEDGALPTPAVMEDEEADVREVFLAVRAWIKARQHSPEDMSSDARALDAGHRRSVFAFLSSVPTRKPIFSAQSRELLAAIAKVPEWKAGGAVDDALLTAALAPPQKARTPTSAARATPAEPPPPASPPPPPVAAAAAVWTGGTVFLPPDRRANGDAPPLAREVEEPPKESDLLSGFPPHEAFTDRTTHDAGDTFKDLRRWARRLAVWDLSTAAGQLEPTVRRDVFRFLLKICERKLYSAQGRELLSMLLMLDEWVDGEDVVDGAAVDRVLDKTAPVAPTPLDPVGRRGRAPSAPPTPSSEKPTPSRPGSPRLLGRGAPPPPSGKPASPGGARAEKHRASSRPADRPKTSLQAAERRDALRQRVEAVLRAGADKQLSVDAPGAELVRLYSDSGLGGQASMTAKALHQESLTLLLAIASQRLRDIYIDDLQRAGGRCGRVHFPHSYIDLRKRVVHPMPLQVRDAVERKIRRRERWTCVEKALVICAEHRLTIRYVLAYALARASAESRSGGVWINVVVTTGATGHANAVCLVPASGGTPARALVYDPNYSPMQEHWVHAQKAINDALPEVARLLAGTGVEAPQRTELFGHGLQTSLGTVESRRAWFSSKIYTTHRGYPICGSLLHILATVWLQVSAGAATDSLSDVEAALAEIVSSGPEGKALVQRCLAGLLRRLAKRFGPQGEEPLGDTMKRRLDRDLKDWPPEATKSGGSITMTGAGGRSCTYTW